MKKIYAFLFFLEILLSCSHAFAQGTWTQKADLPGVGRQYATGFSIGTKGYITCGADCFSSTCYKNDLWEWDQSTNVWTQKANFPGTARIAAVSFSIGTKGYVGTGNDGAYKNDFWEWDQSTNTWLQRANFIGTARQDAVGFSIGNKGYIGTGKGPGPKIDMFEYDPTTNGWTVKANFTGTGKYAAVAFSIGTKGYHCTGFQGGTPPYTSELLEWDQTLNVWTQKATLTGAARIYGVGFSIGAKGYVGTGYNADSIPPVMNDFWEWDQATNTWSRQADYPYGDVAYATGFSIGSRGYIGIGGTSNSFSNDFWEWSPTITSTNAASKGISINIFPNPSNGPFTIENSEMKVVHIEIFDLGGQIIYDENISGTTQIDLSAQPNGIYFLKMLSGNSIAIKKIIIAH